MVFSRNRQPSPAISPTTSGPRRRGPGSFGLLYGLMEQQSALMAYVDVFRWTALLAFFCAGAHVAVQEARQSGRSRRLIELHIQCE
jgi:hypothetical protein